MIDKNTPIGSIIMSFKTTARYKLVAIEYSEAFKTELFFLEPQPPFYNNEQNTFSITLKSINNLKYILV